MKVFLGVTVLPGATEAQARERFEDYRRHADPEAGLAHFAASTGIDFSRYGLDRPRPRQRRKTDDDLRCVRSRHGPAPKAAIMCVVLLDALSHIRWQA